jgi:hypothetical protein
VIAFLLFLSEHAAESLLQFKNGAWLLSYQRMDLEAHVATTSSADRAISRDWCLDSGASCHFCNDSSKFVSLKKCNVSISTAKKGETIQAIGIGNCQITTQTANGELVKLILHDTLYVPSAMIEQKTNGFAGIGVLDICRLTPFSK